MNAQIPNIADTAAQMETLTADAQKTMTAQMEKMTKSLEDAAAWNQESVDAMMKSANIAMKSAEEINAELMAWSKKSMEDSVAAAKDFAASKSVIELMEKQTDFAKSAFDGMFKQMTRFNELAMAASKDAMEPLGARVTAAAELVKKQAA